MDGYELPLMPGDVLDFLNSLNPADIDFIEVLRGGEAGMYGFGVEMVLSQSIPNMALTKQTYSNSNLRVFTPVTYHVCPKFEMPDYSNKEIKNSSNPDPRTTIYWNGNITTDANGEASINFYTADNVTNYIITVTGLTENGDLVYKRVIIDNTGKSQQSSQ